MVMAQKKSCCDLRVNVRVRRRRPDPGFLTGSRWRANVRRGTQFTAEPRARGPAHGWRPSNPRLSRRASYFGVLAQTRQGYRPDRYPLVQYHIRARHPLDEGLIEGSLDPLLMVLDRELAESVLQICEFGIVFEC